MRICEGLIEFISPEFIIGRTILKDLLLSAIDDLPSFELLESLLAKIVFLVVTKLTLFNLGCFLVFLTGLA